MCGGVPKGVDVLELIIVVFRIITAVIKGIFHIIWPPIEKRLKGEIVLITGAGHGIGRELALQFAEHDAIVICLDVNSGRNCNTVQLIKERGFKAHAYMCDISDREQVKYVAAEIKKDIGIVSVIVNNAGILSNLPLLDYTPYQIRNIFNVNILSHFWVIEAFFPDIMQKKRGHIIALSSMCGISGVAGMAPYCATKFAIRGLMESLAEEVRLNGLERRIRFTTVYPFYVDTGMVQDPEYRFPSLFPTESPASAAKKILKAVRQNRTEFSTPEHLLLSTKFIRLFPKELLNVLMDYLSRRKREKEKKLSAKLQ